MDKIIFGGMNHCLEVDWLVFGSVVLFMYGAACFVWGYFRGVRAGYRDMGHPEPY